MVGGGPPGAIGWDGSPPPSPGPSGMINASIAIRLLLLYLVRAAAARCMGMRFLPRDTRRAGDVAQIRPGRHGRHRRRGGHPFGVARRPREQLVKPSSIGLV